MSICMELRIPLFLVGKPGSSKTLAKTVVVDVMQGTFTYDDCKHFDICLPSELNVNSRNLNENSFNLFL